MPEDNEEILEPIENSETEENESIEELETEETTETDTAENPDEPKKGKGKKKYRLYVKDIKIKDLAKEIIHSNSGKMSAKQEEKAEKLFPNIKPAVNQPKVPQPVQLQEGYSPDTAFVVRSERDIETILNAIFTPQQNEEDRGSGDGAYFQHNERAVRLRGIKMKSILIEDCQGFRYTVWFDISRTSMLG